MARREIGTRWDRENRNNINENFKELYDVQDRAIEEATKAIVDSAKLVWLEPVNTFADIATTYPNPETGHTVFVRDTGKVYRFYDGAWMEIQQIDAGPVNEIDTRLSAEIEENKQEIEQARTKADGTTFPVLRDRLNDVDDKIGILSKRAPIEFSVLEFGADNTGATLSTSAIQSAFDALKSGDVLRFPKGTYLISDDLISAIDTSQRSVHGALKLDGKTNIKIVFDKGAILLEKDTFLRGNGIQLTNCQDIIFEGLVYDGNLTAKTLTGYIDDSAVYTRQFCKNIQFINCKVQNTRGHGFNHRQVNQTDYSARPIGILYKDCETYRTRESGFVVEGGEDIKFQNCIAYEAGYTTTGNIGHGFHFEGGSGVETCYPEKIKLDNCHSYSCLNGFYIGSLWYDVELNNCTFNKSTTYGVNIYGNGQRIKLNNVKSKESGSHGIRLRTTNYNNYNIYLEMINVESTLNKGEGVNATETELKKVMIKGLILGKNKSHGMNLGVGVDQYYIDGIVSYDNGYDVDGDATNLPSASLYVKAKKGTIKNVNSVRYDTVKSKQYDLYTSSLDLTIGSIQATGGILVSEVNGVVSEDAAGKNYIIYKNEVTRYPTIFGENKGFDSLLNVGQRLISTGGTFEIGKTEKDIIFTNGSVILPLSSSNIGRKLTFFHQRESGSPVIFPKTGDTIDGGTTSITMPTKGNVIRLFATSLGWITEYKNF